jgi:c-di-GMP-binding flagellar brake protein YcgR
MPVHERRDHFRIDDHMYFDYRILNASDSSSQWSLTHQLLGESGQKHIDLANYFQNMEHLLAQLTQNIALKEPAIAHYLNLLNAKIDYLFTQMMIGTKMQLRKVNISLGGMAFKSTELLKEKSHLKMIIYTKPKMTPIIVDAEVVFCQYQTESNYRVSVVFEQLTPEQEQLLSHHILLAQVKSRAV